LATCCLGVRPPLVDYEGSNNIATRELEITGALKFENCKFENCHFTVTATKENK
jgi:hypothetical protein